MLDYTLIEDASPYYVRFTHPGIENVIKLCQHIDVESTFVSGSDSSFSYKRNPNFSSIQIPESLKKHLFSYIPMSKYFDFQYTSLFVSKPGADFPIHKDGVETTFGFNYNIKILDQDCKTHFYSDDILETREMLIDRNNKGVGVRIVTTTPEDRPIPAKTMTAQQGECLLFNAGKFHDWDNTLSNNIRIILVMRSFNTSHLKIGRAHV